NNYANASLTPTELVLSGRIMTFWTNFAATGNPNGRGKGVLQVWPAYVLGDVSTIMNLDTQPASGPVPLPSGWPGAGPLWGNCLRWVEYFGFPSPLSADEPADEAAAEILSSLSGEWKGSLSFDGQTANCTVADTLTFEGAALTVALSGNAINAPLQTDAVIFA